MEKLQMDGSPTGAVPISKRAFAFYLQDCRVFQEGSHTAYQKGDGPTSSIPDKNTIFLLLGKGASISNAAVKTLSESEVLVGFSNPNGQPVFLTDFRPTTSPQTWMAMGLQETKRLATGKALLKRRAEITEELWAQASLHIKDEVIDSFLKSIAQGKSLKDLSQAETLWANSLLQNQKENPLLPVGNHISQAFAAAALQSLGISPAFPILQNERNSPLSDIASLFHEGITLPLLFKKEEGTEKEFPNLLIQSWQKNNLLSQMISEIKTLMGISQ